MRLMFAELEIDVLRQELLRSGVAVHVEPQVFDLLVHLVRHRDRVISKDELFETIWSRRIVSEAALSSRINAARKAIGDDGERQQFIKTIHKRGFRFIGNVEVLGAETPGGFVPDVATRAPSGSEPLSAGQAIHTSGASNPSVAVTPFVNLSSEPDTEYFSYGLTEDIIRLLARNRWLKVLSRHSSATFKRQDIGVQEIGAALGVRYLVNGSVLKSGGRVRITADLIGAGTGQQLWSETYNLDLADVLQIQEAMAQQIAAAIEPELAKLEREAAIRKPPDNLDAWDCYQRGLWSLWGFTTPSMMDAGVMFRRAIELDPGFARAYGALSYMFLQRSFLCEPEERPALLENAMRYARKAVALDDRDCMNLCVLGRAHCMLKDYGEAVAALEQCIALNPRFAQGYFALGFAMTWCGREQEALALVERAIELSPRDPHLTSFYHIQALAHFSRGDLESALAHTRKAVRLQNASACSLAVHSALLGLLGRAEEARPAVAELLGRMPNYSCATGRSDLFFCADEVLIGRFEEGLRRAGLPEGPSGRVSQIANAGGS